MSMTVAAEHPFNKIARQTSKLMDQLQKGYYNFYPGETWTPNVNLYETERSYLVCVDLAGVDKDKIDIEVHQNVLKIRGTRPVPLQVAEGESVTESARKLRVHLMEIDHGSFSRTVELPQGASREGITAVHHNGILWVEIPKS